MEIIVECPNKLVDKVAKVVKECMVKAGSLFYTRVPLDASCEIGTYWK